MIVERDNRGRLQNVSKPKGKGHHGHSNPKDPSYDRPTQGYPGRAPLPPDRYVYGPGRVGYGPPPYSARPPDRSRYPPTSDPPLDSARPPDGSGYPPIRDPPRDIRPPARTPESENPARRNRPQLFEETSSGRRLRPEDLYGQSCRDVSLDTGTGYQCTQKDLDACGGQSRRASRKTNHAQLIAMWFPRPNRGKLVSTRRATLDIVEHNALERIPPAVEESAIDRLLTMFDNARQGSWSPDVAIKAFCDLDTVFFRGRLRGHVCVTWATQEAFYQMPGSHCFGHTVSLGQGKALIQLNAHDLLLEGAYNGGRPISQTFATLLHEMMKVFNLGPARKIVLTLTKDRHAYLMVQSPSNGREGWLSSITGPTNGHDKGFGTMMLAVNYRAMSVLGLEGDQDQFPYYDYGKGEGLPRP